MTEFDTMETYNNMNDNTQTIVLVHFKSAGDLLWDTDIRHFDRVPQAGEYLTMARDADWYEVRGVLHMAFPLDYDAEIFCVKVGDPLAVKQGFGG